MAITVPSNAHPAHRIPELSDPVGSVPRMAPKTTSATATAQLTGAHALALRMRSLLLRPRPAGEGRPAPADVAGVVSWFGAMQAQDLASGLWSLGCRLPGWTQADVLAALERREAIRTWPMRGTVHWTPLEDAHWMLDLMGIRALAGAQKRREFLGISTEVANRAVDVLGKALAGGGRLTRSQCMSTLTEAGIDCAGQAGYHLMWYASQCGVTCIAPNVGKEQSFVLLDEWAPQPRRPGREEALALIALRYFRSHGPTTRQDFAGWTGLTMTDAKLGIAGAGDALTGVRIDGVEAYADSELLASWEPGRDRPDLLALPGFDEYLLGFKDRSLMVAEEHKQAIIPGGNGVFQSTLVRDGRVVAIWKRTTGRKATTIAVTPLVAFSAAERTRAEAAFTPYASYLDTPVEIRWA
jgi:Winged helix DNA-binding domain